MSEFEDFTDGAKETLFLAAEEARRVGHNFIGTEQLLLGLIAYKSSPIKRVFDRARIELESVRLQVDKVIGRGPGHVDENIPLTPRVKKVLEDARRQARERKADKIDEGHILLALLSHEEGVFVRILMALEIDTQRLAATAKDVLGAKPRESSDR